MLTAVAQARITASPTRAKEKGSSASGKKSKSTKAG
jgi:hypothetical protein